MRRPRPLARNNTYREKLGFGNLSLGFQDLRALGSPGPLPKCSNPESAIYRPKSF
jgi:hypothetical protein